MKLALTRTAFMTVFLFISLFSFFEDKAWAPISVPGDETYGPYQCPYGSGGRTENAVISPDHGLPGISVNLQFEGYYPLELIGEGGYVLIGPLGQGGSVACGWIQFDQDCRGNAVLNIPSNLQPGLYQLEINSSSLVGNIHFYQVGQFTVDSPVQQDGYPVESSVAAPSRLPETGLPAMLLTAGFAGAAAAGWFLRRLRTH